MIMMNKQFVTRVRACVMVDLPHSSFVPGPGVGVSDLPGRSPGGSQGAQAGDPGTNEECGRWSVMDGGTPVTNCLLIIIIYQLFIIYDLLYAFML